MHERKMNRAISLQYPTLGSYVYPSLVSLPWATGVSTFTSNWIMTHPRSSILVRGFRLNQHKVQRIFASVLESRVVPIEGQETRLPVTNDLCKGGIHGTDTSSSAEPLDTAEATKHGGDVQTKWMRFTRVITTSNSKFNSREKNPRAFEKHK